MTIDNAIKAAWDAAVESPTSWELWEDYGKLREQRGREAAEEREAKMRAMFVEFASHVRLTTGNLNLYARNFELRIEQPK